LATINSNGIGVRHAIARALATANLAPSDAVFRVRRARVDLDRQGGVARAEASIELAPALPLDQRSPEDLHGLVNPDGQHPLMVWLPGDPSRKLSPFFMDILAVSWSRWLACNEGTLPPGCDSFAPVIGQSLTEARQFAATKSKRLPRLEEFRAAWGPQPLPWGEAPDPSCGQVGRPRYDILPEGGLHPPTHSGLFDLGVWLWQRLDDGRIAGGRSAADGLAAAEAELNPDAPSSKLGHWPIGFRLVQDA